MKLLLENWRKFIKEESTSKLDKLNRLRAARDTIASQSAEECFLGSCADTSFLLWWAAQRSGMSGVELVAGSAEPPAYTDEPPADHVWLTVDGEVYDPTWEYQDISPEEVKYEGTVVDFEKEPNALEYFGVDEVEESEGWDSQTNFIMHHFSTKGDEL